MPGCAAPTALGGPERDGEHEREPMRSLRRRGMRILYDVVREPSAAVAARVESSNDIAHLIRQRREAGLIPSAREVFVAVLLNAKYEALAFEVVSVGTLNQSPVHPREVFRAAIALPAAAIVIAHTHPSGDCDPSPDDRKVTDRLQKCGEILGIEVLDHVIVGKAEFYSFATETREVIR